MAKERSALARLQRPGPQLAIQGNRDATFDPIRFTWLGSLSSYADDAYMLLVNASHRAHTVVDLKQSGNSLTIGADNLASSNLIFGLISREVLGLNVSVVRGLSGRCADIPCHAEWRTGRANDRAKLGQERATRLVEPAGVPAAVAVRPPPPS